MTASQIHLLSIMTLPVQIQSIAMILYNLLLLVRLVIFKVSMKLIHPRVFRVILVVVKILVDRIVVVCFIPRSLLDLWNLRRPMKAICMTMVHYYTVTSALYST